MGLGFLFRVFFRVWGFGLGWGFWGCGVLGLGFKGLVKGLGFWVFSFGLGFTVQFRVEGIGTGVGFRVKGFWFRGLD